MFKSQRSIADLFSPPSKKVTNSEDAEYLHDTQNHIDLGNVALNTTEHPTPKKVAENSAQNHPNIVSGISTKPTVTSSNCEIDDVDVINAKGDNTESELTASDCTASVDCTTSDCSTRDLVSEQRTTTEHTTCDHTTSHRISHCAAKSLKLKRKKQNNLKRRCDKLYSLINSKDSLDFDYQYANGTLSDETTIVDGSSDQVGNSETVEYDYESDSEGDVYDVVNGHTTVSRNSGTDNGCVTVSYEDFINNYNDPAAANDVISYGSQVSNSGCVVSPNDDLTINAEKNKQIYGSIQRFFSNGKSHGAESGTAECESDTPTVQTNVDVHTVESNQDSLNSCNTNVGALSSNLEQKCDDRISVDNAVCDADSNDDVEPTSIIDDRVCVEGSDIKTSTVIDNAQSVQLTELNCSTLSEDCCVILSEPETTIIPDESLPNDSKKHDFLHSHLNSQSLESDTRTKQSTLGFVIPKLSASESSQSDFRDVETTSTKTRTKKQSKKTVPRRGRLKNTAKNRELNTDSEENNTDDCVNDITVQTVHQSKTPHSKQSARTSSNKTETNPVKNKTIESNESISTKLKVKFVTSKLKSCNNSDKKSGKRKRQSSERSIEPNRDGCMTLRRSPRIRPCVTPRVEATEECVGDAGDAKPCGNKRSSSGITKPKARKVQDLQLKKTVSAAQKLVNSAKAKRRSKDSLHLSKCPPDTPQSKKKSTKKERKAAVKDGGTKKSAGNDVPSDGDDVIIIGEDDAPKPTRKKSASTPKKGNTALAPMFIKTTKDNSDSPKTPDMDPEALRRKKAFLMSCASEVKRVEDAAMTIELPHFPDIPHVTQIDPDVTLVEATDVTWKWREMVELCTQQKGWGDGFVDLTPVTPSTFTPHPRPEISDDSIGTLLKEIQACNHQCTAAAAMFERLNTQRLASDSLSQLPSTDASSEPIVIDASPEQDKPSKPKRSKLQLKKATTESDNLKPPSPTPRLMEMLWTEKYRPESSSDVIGNSRANRRLLRWLEEWKQRSQKETQRLKRQMARDIREAKAAEYDSAGEFEGESEGEYDEEEDVLCNTVVLTGPHGVGKTASVYALAQQLGFQVFEVNTASCRNGKKILSQLQEVCQSHQVCKQGLSKAFTPAHSLLQLKVDSPKKSSPAIKLPTAFSNLFKKATTNPDDIASSPVKGKKVEPVAASPAKSRKKSGGKANKVEEVTNSPAKGRKGGAKRMSAEEGVSSPVKGHKGKSGAKSVSSGIVEDVLCSPGRGGKNKGRSKNVTTNDDVMSSPVRGRKGKGGEKNVSTDLDEVLASPVRGRKVKGRAKNVSNDLDQVLSSPVRGRKGVTKNNVTNDAEEAISSPGRGRRNRGVDGEGGAKRKRSDKFEKTPSKKKKMPDIEIIAMETKSSDSNTRGLNLSSLSLILFDEVDVVLEDDRGFLSTIQSFMETTKRPIILTTSDPNFVINFEGFLENIIYKQPNTGNVASYLQLVCLSEGLRTDYTDIHRIVSLYHGDVRRCLLTLQMWVESGGGSVVQTDSEILATKISSSQSVNFTLSRDSMMSCGASCDNTLGSQAPISPPTALTICPVKPSDDNAMFVDITSQSLPPRHVDMFNTVVGLQPAQLALLLPMNGLPTPTTSTTPNLISSCHLTTPTTDLHPHIHKLIHLPTYTLDADNWPIVSDGVPLPFRKTKTPPPKRRRIRLLEMESSDSEQSCDAVIDQGDNIENNDTNDGIEDKNEDKNEDSNMKSGQSGSDVCGESEITKFWKQQVNELVENTTEVDRKSVSECLNVLVRAYDTTSFMDCYMSAVISDNCVMSNVTSRVTSVTVSPGLLDEHGSDWSVSEVSGNVVEVAGDIQRQCEVMLLSHCGQRVRDVLGLKVVESEVVGLKVVGSEVVGSSTVPTGVAVPVKEGEPWVTLAPHKLRHEAEEEAIRNVRQRLPLTSSSRGVDMDYLPYLRAVCRSEKVREDAKLKRRFLHYLDSVSLNLKDSTQQLLRKTFS